MSSQREERWADASVRSLTMEMNCAAAALAIGKSSPHRLASVVEKTMRVIVDGSRVYSLPSRERLSIEQTTRRASLKVAPLVEASALLFMCSSTAPPGPARSASLSHAAALIARARLVACQEIARAVACSVGEHIPTAATRAAGVANAVLSHCSEEEAEALIRIAAPPVSDLH